MLLLGPEPGGDRAEQRRAHDDREHHAEHEQQRLPALVDARVVRDRMRERQWRVAAQRAQSSSPRSAAAAAPPSRREREAGGDEQAAGGRAGRGRRRTAVTTTEPRGGVDCQALQTRWRARRRHDDQTIEVGEQRVERR